MPMAEAIEEATGVSIFDPLEKLEEARITLNSGLSAKLMREWRGKESGKICLEFMVDPKYVVLVLGAYMMHVGAKIDNDDRKHMKELLPQVRNSKGYVWLLGDPGFRDPGHKQITAALEYYVNGKWRDFFQPSCYNCGKVSSDLGGMCLKKCTKCTKHEKKSYYCNQECQKEN